MGIERHPVVYLHPLDGIKGIPKDETGNEQIYFAQNIFSLDENGELNKNKAAKKGWDAVGETFTFDRLYCVEAMPGNYQLQKLYLAMDSNRYFNAFIDHAIKLESNQCSYLAIQMTITKQRDGSFKYSYGFVIPKEEISGDSEKKKKMFPKLFEKYNGSIATQIPIKLNILLRSSYNQV